MLRLRTSGTTQRIRATTLVQAVTLGEGVRDFLFDAFLHVARHNRPPLATADGQSPSPHGGSNLGAPHRLGATPSRTPRAGAGGHLGPHPLPRARHGPPPTKRHPQRSEIEPHGVYILNSECTLFELRADSDQSSSFIIIIIHHASCVMCHASCVMTCWRPSMCFSHSNPKLHFRSELTQPQPHSYGFL